VRGSAASLAIFDVCTDETRERFYRIERRSHGEMLRHLIGVAEDLDEAIRIYDRHLGVDSTGASCHGGGCI